jgi:nucleoside-diphosphate-sugar epimerase
MKIIVIGATGTVGKPIVAALQARHEVIKVGSKSGDHQVDFKDSGSIRKLLKKPAGSMRWSPASARCISANSPS